MTSKSPSIRRRPVPETVAPQDAITQQAQAADAAQSRSDDSTRQEAPLQEVDLVTPDVAGDHIPPPAYGDVYGEIRNEKDGMGTSARVTDDGRVNIHINQLNRRLSQVFIPALRQQIESAQESLPPPSTPSVLPPSLNVVIQVVGSRGDVQPFVALGKVLKDAYGHRVRLATHPNFKAFVEENGLEFFSIGGDPSRLMAFMAKNPSLMPGFRSILDGDVGKRRKDVAEYIQGCWRSCYEAGDGMDSGATEDDLSDASDSTARPFVADCIIANPPSFAHIHCAEKLGIPLHIMFTMPYSPTQAFPHPLANIQSNADPQLTNYISYAMIELLSWQGVGDIINRFRAKCLDLEPVSTMWAPGMLQRLKVPHTYCWSPALIPKPKDWGSHISISGFYFLNSSSYTPAADLQAFLDAGPTPVYIGFGSIVLEHPDEMTALIFEAVRKTGQRVLLSKGWGGIGAETVPEGVFMLGNVPHDWLFQHVSCVVHHGGAGTTAAGITAGRPTIVVPFFGDQQFWGAMVARAGAGPDPIPFKRLTADNLADAINFCLQPSTLECAQVLATKIASERGSETGAESFHQFLEVDRLRCTLAPSRPAAWRIRRTKIRLSAFAACTLANANLLDFKDLKLFRPQEYATDEGPVDPISGGFTTACRAFGNMTRGLAETPNETWKAFAPSEPGRQQSQASVPTIARHGDASRGEDGAVPTPSSSEDQHDTINRARRSSSKLSTVSSLTSDVGSTSLSETSQDPSSSKSTETSLKPVRSRVESRSDKDRDMLRHTAHADKGAGRFMKAALLSPMDFSHSFTQGFHNVPKLWGDETVRPQQRVDGLKSGMQAMGKEFGLGFYDGLTGVVTQPWKGAQKEGASGFFKGVGKGFGGLVPKLGAACMGILSHPMKGIYKEVLKAFKTNVQSYIIASRAAQGYEEWLQSPEAEKQDVIERWRLIQKYVKKKRNQDEMMRDVLEAHETRNGSNAGRPASSVISSDCAAPTADFESTMLAMDGRMSVEEMLEVADIDDFEDPSRGEAEDEGDVFQAIQENVSQLQRRQQEFADHQTAQQDLRQTITVSEVLSDRGEVLQHDKELERAMAQSQSEQQQWSSEEDRSSNLALDDEEDEEFERATARFNTATHEAGTVAADVSTPVQHPPAYDPGHLAGTTQSEFEAQRQGKGGEKSAQERTEEEVVMAYVKKQSLLEEQHYRNKGKERAQAVDDLNDEDLQTALRLSMQGHGSGNGGSSGM